jgi:hypothetical protein
VSTSRKNLFVSVTGHRGIAVNALGGVVCLDTIQDPDPNGGPALIAPGPCSAALSLDEACALADEILTQVREALTMEVRG